MTKTILIMAGGTGGHIFPALAVAGELKRRGWRVVWLGSRAGMEAQIVPAQGYQIEWIRFSGLRGKGILRLALLPLNLLIAFWQSARVIFRLRPDVVLGMGGYVTFPGGMMAAGLLRPLVIHEQNAIAGLANRMLAHVADKVLVAFPGTLRNSQWTGNPVRAEIASIADPGQRLAHRQGRLRLLVVGGSLGAKALNETVPRAIAQMPTPSRPVVTHQSGRQHLEALQAEYRHSGVDATIVAFIEDMAAAYEEADLVICRAGATTIAELCAAGIASVLIPFPHAVDDHQTKNARYLSENGAALLMPQSDLTPSTLAETLSALTRDRILDLSRNARALGKPDALSRVAELCIAAAA